MNHSWYAVLTAPVLMNPNLSDKQKLLIAVISNLQNEKGYCFASNKYLSDCLNCSEVTIRQNISTLEEKGFIGRVIKLNDKGEIEYRSLTIIEQVTPPIKNNHTPDENQSLPPDENQSHNNKLLKTNIFSVFTEFSVFWDLYDYKVGKPESEKSWNKLKEHEKQKCIDSLPAWLEWNKTLTWKSKPYPSTFLNKKRWLDEIPKSEKILGEVEPGSNWIPA